MYKSTCTLICTELYVQATEDSGGANSVEEGDSDIHREIMAEGIIIYTVVL